MKIIVGISNRHAHLTQSQIDQLFGQGYQLTFFRQIKQPDEFASNEKIHVVGPKGQLRDVRIMGPARQTAQIEMTLTDARAIGVSAQVRVSAQVKDTAGIRLIGPVGEVLLEEGVIAAARHLHLTPKEAELLGLQEGQQVAVETEGERGVIFKHVLVRIDELFSLELHLDTDEANAAGVKNGDEVKLIKDWPLLSGQDQSQGR